MLLLLHKDTLESQTADGQEAEVVTCIQTPAEAVGRGKRRGGFRSCQGGVRREGEVWRTPSLGLGNRVEGGWCRSLRRKNSRE